MTTEQTSYFDRITKSECIVPTVISIPGGVILIIAIILRSLAPTLPDIEFARSWNNTAYEEKYLRNRAVWFFNCNSENKSWLGPFIFKLEVELIDVKENQSNVSFRRKDILQFISETNVTSVEVNKTDHQDKLLKIESLEPFNEWFEKLDKSVIPYNEKIIEYILKGSDGRWTYSKNGTFVNWESDNFDHDVGKLNTTDNLTECPVNTTEDCPGCLTDSLLYTKFMNQKFYTQPPEKRSSLQFTPPEIWLERQSRIFFKYGIQVTFNNGSTKLFPLVIVEDNTTMSYQAEGALFIYDKSLRMVAISKIQINVVIGIFAVALIIYAGLKFASIYEGKRLFA